MKNIQHYPQKLFSYFKMARDRYFQLFLRGVVEKLLSRKSTTPVTAMQLVMKTSLSLLNNFTSYVCKKEDE